MSYFRVSVGVFAPKPMSAAQSAAAAPDVETLVDDKLHVNVLQKREKFVKYAEDNCECQDVPVNAAGQPVGDACVAFARCSCSAHGTAAVAIHQR